MNFKDFTQKIDFLKNKKLGGLNAQFKMAPKLRLKYNQDKINANNPRKAAVLALFYPNKTNETCFLLTKRASYKGTHSAQFAATSIPSSTIDLGTIAASSSRIMSAGGACQNRSCIAARSRFRSSMSVMLTSFLGKSFKSKESEVVCFRFG